jgi:hypothetical protein
LIPPCFEKETNGRRVLLLYGRVRCVFFCCCEKAVVQRRFLLMTFQLFSTDARKIINKCSLFIDAWINVVKQFIYWFASRMESLHLYCTYPSYSKAELSLRACLPPVCLPACLCWRIPTFRAQACPPFFCNDKHMYVCISRLILLLRMLRASPPGNLKMSIRNFFIGWDTSESMFRNWSTTHVFL